MHETDVKRGAVAVLIGTALVLGVGAQGPPPTISLPSLNFPAGPDYATEVLQDPWDFNNYEDLSPDPDHFRGWTAPWRTVGTGPAFLSGGLFTGVSTGDPSGASLSVLNLGDALALNPGRSGIRFPIDTSRYRKIAIKAQSGLASLVAQWYHAAPAEPGWESQIGAGAFGGSTPDAHSVRVYTADLTAIAAGGAAYGSFPAVKGLMLGVPANQQISIDWVRLTAANNQAHAAMMPVTLSNCTDFRRFTVYDQFGFPVDITEVGGSGSTRTFNYGIFPPGQYSVAANCANGDTRPVDFWINAPPSVTVIDPDETGDPSTDYAATARGDAWDFEQLTDLARVFNVSTTGGVCPPNGAGCGIVPSERGGHMLRASTVGAFGDPGLEFLDGVDVPLNSRRHRLLTFSLRIHRPYLLSAQVGPVARVLWSSAASGDGYSMTHTQDMRVWPGFQTYTIDLGALTTSNGGIETDCGICPQTPWVTRALRFLRLDPHEIGDAPSAFDIDDVRLTARDQVAHGQTFTVRFAFSDADPAGSGYTARVYLQPWPGRTQGGRTRIATLPGLGPGQHAYSFNPLAQGIAEGEYTISVDVDEAHPNPAFTQTSRAFATGALVVTNPGASTPRISVRSPVPGQNIGLPVTIEGCAYDDGQFTGGINVDDLAIRMRAVAGPRTGVVLPLGFEPNVPHTGTIQFGPLGSIVPCPSGSGPYANAGFRVSGVGAGLGDWMNGTWMIDVFARSTLSGEMIQLPEIPIVIGPAPPPAPSNFQASAAGNTVTVSWDPAPGGAAYYQIQGALDPSFTTLAFRIDVPAAGTYSGQLGSGRYYLRVYARSTSGAWSGASPTRQVDVALPTPPGPPSLVATQVASNPVTLNWSPGPGGAPSSYTIHAGTSPGTSNLVVAPVGLATSISANAPPGTPVYVRVIAANAAGQSQSNEIGFTLAPPAAPTLNPAVVSGRNVTLSWSPAAGSAASSYTVRARLPGSPAVIASLPVAATGVTVPAPPGAYVVTVVAHNAQGTSAESNAINVTVR